MKVGDKWLVTIPPSLGYGEEGFQSIGPNELLIFELELLDVVKK
jgi:FKBP-type peptidyl-prolyl cis-trans isomerase